MKCTTYAHKAQTLLWKIFLMHKKHWFLTTIKTVIPPLLFGLLVLINSFVPQLKGEPKDAQIFKNEDLLDELTKIASSPEKTVVLYQPKNQLTDDLMSNISLSLKFFVQNILEGKLNIGKLFVLRSNLKQCYNI